jgi:hypothetical protein
MGINFNQRHTFLIPEIEHVIIKIGAVVFKRKKNRRGKSKQPDNKEIFKKIFESRYNILHFFRKITFLKYYNINIYRLQAIIYGKGNVFKKGCPFLCGFREYGRLTAVVTHSVAAAKLPLSSTALQSGNRRFFETGRITAYVKNSFCRLTTISLSEKRAETSRPSDGF